MGSAGVPRYQNGHDFVLGLLRRHPLPVMVAAAGLGYLVSDAGRRSSAQLARHRRGIEGFVEENPVMVGVVGLAAGLLVGALLPTTRRENQVFGRYADEVREQGMRYARELAEQGKSLVEENLQAVSQGTGRGDRDTGDESRAS